MIQKGTKISKVGSNVQNFTVVNKCFEEEKTSSLLLLLNVNSFEGARHLNIKSDTPYLEAKHKLKDYCAVTETKEELREKLN